MVLAKFRQKYPQGSLVSELIDIDRGTYIVRVSAIAENVTLATGLAGDERVEIAEDKARERAIAALNLDSNLVSSSKTSDQTITDFVPHSLAKPQSQVFTPSAISQPKIATNSDFVKNNESTPVELETSNAEVSSQAVDNLPAAETVAPKTTVEPEMEIKSESTAVPITNNLFEGTYSTAEVSPNLAPESSNLGIRNTTTATAEVPQADELAVAIDFHDIIHQTDIEVKRLGWTKNDGKEFLKSRYGKYSRVSLSDDQLLEFLEYLKSQPTPS